MSTIQFLAEWAVRSSVLILAGALVVVALRVKDSSIRLMAWVALLCGSVALPLMTMSLPPVRVIAVRPDAESVVFFDSLPVAAVRVSEAAAKPHAPFDWARAGLVLYFAIALALILRVGIGLAMSRRLLRGSRETREPGVRESDDVMAPVTLGIVRAVIVLPVDWREWDDAKLTAVLAHERSHIGRFDPAVQLLSAVHRAVLWFSPAGWFLHSRIVRTAEEASDDAAVTVTRDRESYAQFLLEFMSCEECGAGVPMARYGAPEKRIYRILDGKSLSRGVTRWSAAAIVMLGVPLAYLAASVRSEELPARAVAAVRKTIPEGLPLIPQFIAQVQAPPLPKPPAPPAVERPKFEVASIRPCDPDAAPPGRGGRGGGGGGTGIFRLNCITVKRPTGLDIGESTCAFARRRGVSVKRLGLEDYSPKLRKPEAVFIWNCFEQLEDPSRTLRQSYRMLDKHGLLLVRVPNADFYREQRWRLRNLHSQAALNLLGYNNLLGFPYRHGYTPATLDRLLRIHRFEPLATHDSSVIEPPYPQMSAQICEEWRKTRHESERPRTTGGPWIEILCRKRLS